MLELGAGIGMTGMAAAACCGAKEVVLTDYAPRYLWASNLGADFLSCGTRLKEKGPFSVHPCKRLTSRPLELSYTLGARVGVKSMEGLQ